MTNKMRQELLNESFVIDLLTTRAKDWRNVVSDFSIGVEWAIPIAIRKSDLMRDKQSKTDFYKHFLTLYTKRIKEETVPKS